MRGTIAYITITREACTMQALMKLAPGVGNVGIGDIPEPELLPNHVIIEVASFSPTKIRKTAKRLSLKTEASHRFERGTDVDRLVDVAERVADLIALGMKEAKLPAPKIADAVVDNYPADVQKRVIAIRLTGKFKTAFPEGKPADPAAAADKKDDKKSEALKESKDETAVILVADADMLADQFCVRVQDFFGQRIVQPLNANLTLVQNFVEQLSGDSNLIGTRSRASLNRPFTLVRDMQAKAEESYRAKIKGFEENLQKTQSKLNELQRNKDKSQRFILSPEQQKEIENLRKDEARMKKDLKDERKNLRRDIDSLENRIKWLNIAGMPLLVTLSGITLALLKRQRTAAK